MGYNDEDGTANDYWVMLNSWGTAGDGRPNGLFHLAMDMDYDCAHYDGGWWYSFYWQTLDITYDVEPTVTNTGATNITSTSARLNGEVTSTGGENPTVHIYWGDNDGGTTTGSWDNDVNLGTKGTGTFYTDISGLDTGTTTYYYRCYATNSGGTAWADSTNSFRYRTTLDRQVGASSDDSRVWDSIGSGSWDTTYTTFLVGHMTAEKYKGRSCARFTNITIPQGATITEAHLTLRADRSLSNTTVNSKLACETAEVACVFPEDYDIIAALPSCPVYNGLDAGFYVWTIILGICRPCGNVIPVNGGCSWPSGKVCIG